MPQRKRILIIEPDPGFCAYMERALSRSTYLVESVSSAEEGLARIEANTPDLVLLDLVLLQLDGFAVCEHIR